MQLVGNVNMVFPFNVSTLTVRFGKHVLRAPSQFLPPLPQPGPWNLYQYLPVEQGSKRPGDLVHLQDVVTNLSPKDLSSVVPQRENSSDVSG